MSEWVSVIAVFWALWALDGVRLAARGTFTLLGGAGRTGVRVLSPRWSRPGVWPWSWRANAVDVPLALSPAGICNRPVGAVSRPVEKPATVQAWRWAEVREVGVARGQLYINGAAFCAHTGHVSGTELLELAQMPAAQRERRIRALLARWLRPAHLRRRTTVLRARTAGVAVLNTFSLVLLAAISAYVAGDVAASLPARWSEAVTRALPLLLAYLLCLHVAAVLFAWRAVRRLRVPRERADRRGSALFAALLLPPQALRLRAIAGDGFFPVQHPLAQALAWGDRGLREEWAFRTLADLQWPIGTGEESSLGHEVRAWFRSEWEPRVEARLRAEGIEKEKLFAAPEPDSPASCLYCPRCRDQFGSGLAVCPHGVPLASLRGR